MFFGDSIPLRRQTLLTIIITMEIKQLQLFITVANTGSVTVAARRCNIAKSSVSRQIAALEEELGEPLFDKNNVLTEIGKKFLTRANNIIKEVQESKNELEAMKGNVCGELHIGVGSFIAPYIRKASVIFLKRYPNVVLHAQFDHAHVLNKMLHDNQLDLAFTMNTAYHYEEITSKPSIPFTLSAIMSRNHALADKEYVTFDDLMQCKIIMPDVGERVFQAVQRYTPFEISRLPVSCIVSSASEALSVLDELDMITFLPSEYIISSHDLVAKPIATLDMQLTSNAHWKKGVPLKESAKRFLDIIREITEDKD